MKRERKKNCQVVRIPGLAAEDESSGDRTTKKVTEKKTSQKTTKTE